MTYAGSNGRAVPLEFEVTHAANPYDGVREDEVGMHEWELPELGHESSHEFEDEMEWETHEAHPYSSPYAAQEVQEVQEGEWESPEAHPYSNPFARLEAHEFEWEAHEAHPYSNPYATQELSEDEWELPEAHPEWEAPEAQEFFPPSSNRRPLVRMARRLVPLARATAPGVVRIIIRVPLGRLLRQFAPLLREGEQEAAQLEAQFFGQSEAEAEVAGHEAAHEAALTEVLAAEAAHTESEDEAAALLGAALPITIRILGAGPALRPITPTLLRANARLVRGLHRGGASRRQLVRVVPGVHRRVVASLRAATRTGRPLTPRLAAGVMAAQTARVLGSPTLTGRGLVRNAVIRQTTVGSPRRRVRRAGCGGCGGCGCK